MNSPWLNNRNLFNTVSNIFFYLSLLIITLQLVGFGGKLLYSESYFQFVRITNFLFGIFSVFVSIYIYLKEDQIVQKVVKSIFIGVSVFFLIASFQWLVDTHFLPINSRGNVLFFSIFIAFMSISQKMSNIRNSGLHAALIFVISFIFLVLCGTFLLLLPYSSTKTISVVDALFTITSGVTVTGLGVLNTGKDLTLFGQTVLLIFIQLGGLGVLTFTNLFSLVLKADNSFTNRLMVGEMIKELNNKDTYSTLIKIVGLTLIIEMIGTLLVYVFTYGNPNIDNGFFFAAFHAISAFCNAGFSLFSDQMYDESLRFNYPLHLTITWLLITGGISYSVMINHNHMLSNKMKIINKWINPDQKIGCVNKVSINNSLVIKTTFYLLVIGAILFYIFERNNVLAEHGWFGKIAVSIFNSATPRTAGFNNVNMTDLTMPTFMIILFLMWVGASPGSTGGGIKTTTFAVVCLNLFNQIKGRTKLVYKWREIPLDSINQANAVIMLSFFAIGTSTLCLTYFEKDMLLKDLLFEVVSAYSTVGLSMGITHKLTDASKIVIMITMFLGRVSFLTFLIGLYRQFFKEHKREVAQYPEENVFIN